MIWLALIGGYLFGWYCGNRTFRHWINWIVLSLFGFILRRIGFKKVGKPAKPQQKEIKQTDYDIIDLKRVPTITLANEFFKRKDVTIN